MAARVVLDSAGIRALLTSPNGEIGRDLLRRARQVEAEAKRLAPVDKGLLRSSIQTEIRNDGGVLSARVGTNVKYALFVHEGTKPHVIRGRPNLAFVWPNAPAAFKGKKVSKGGKRGPFVVFRSVQHPGTRPRPFLRQALARFNP